MDIDTYINKAISGLKDFQQATVNHVIQQYYKNGKSKILIADEVGLGKTIVAKGVIAKMFEKHIKDTGKGKKFEVVYICSNQTIAKQNLNKLNIFAGEENNRILDYSENDDRITSLAYEPRKINNDFNFRIKAFTPATSFDQKSSAGKADERVLLFRLLFKHSYLKDKTNSLKWLLKGSRRMKDENWEKLIYDAISFEEKGTQRYKHYGEYRQLRKSIKSKFYKEVSKKIPVSVLPEIYNTLQINKEKPAIILLSKICNLNIRKNNYTKEKYAPFFQIIRYLRGLLANSCKEFLNADLFILDEFQRYSNILATSESDNPGIELARQVLNKQDSKILMLSATPFKPYTSDFDQLNGEYHYKEFKNVLWFLMDKNITDKQKYITNSKAFFKYLRHPEELIKNYNKAENVKKELESTYRKYIARTERMIVSKERDAMINSNIKILDIHEEDIDDFVQFDKLVNYLNKKQHTKLSAPIEYVKSSPYPLSFLFDYLHKKKIEEIYRNDNEFKKLIKETKRAWVNINNVKRYEALKRKNYKVIPNAKIRLLINETVKKKGWKYLWIPPSVPYYELNGAYTKADNFTKTLIFSSWKMVPRMIATILSYEVERHSVGQYLRQTKDNLNYYKKKRSPAPLLVFKTKGDTLSGMNNFMLNYPSIFLSSIYDPEQNLFEKQSIQKIKQKLKQKIALRLKELNIFSIGNEKGDWQKWSWYSILLLDKNHPEINSLKKWLKNELYNNNFFVDTDGHSKAEAKEEKIGKKRHLQEIYTFLNSNEVPNVNKISVPQFNKLVDFLVDVALGSPASSALRALKKIFLKEKEIVNLIRDSYYIASGFISLFNKPESIAVVQLMYKRKKYHNKDYYNKVLQYCIDGNIQSMLDEYFYLLTDSSGINTSEELANVVSSILSIRPSPLDIGSINDLEKKGNTDQHIKSKIRTHYALDFGMQRLSSTAAKRQINIREAFNSPFRPFVLASTSIGQEGLDFHFYCKRIFHWNLPSNPIDFEQREGRIHRYKGHVIRLNVSKTYKDKLEKYNQSTHLWTQLFNLAEKDKSSACCDLIPYWHLENKTGIKIDRFVPLYPYSKDIEKFLLMQKVLAYYRLTLGQPRQEELIKLFDKKDYSSLLKSLIISLAPINYKK